MRRAAAATVWITTAAMLVVAGCGGGSSSTGTGGHGGGTTGAGGQGGGAATNGQGGAAGSLGAGGTGNAGGNLPVCAIVQRPNDPTNPAASPAGGTCNSIQLVAPPVAAEALDVVDGGARADGGAVATPAGGTVLDGDYDLVRLQNQSGYTSVRTIRVFGGGTYIEWAQSNALESSQGQDAGYVSIWYDTTVQPSGQSLVLTYACGQTAVYSYGFTTEGNDLALFSYNNAGTTLASLYSVDTYRRTCTRP